MAQRGFFNFLTQRTERDNQNGLFNVRDSSTNTFQFTSKKDARGSTSRGSALDFSSQSTTTNRNQQTTNNQQDNRSLVQTDSRSSQQSISRVFSPTQVFTLNSPNADTTVKKPIDIASDFRNLPSITASPSLGGAQEPSQSNDQSGGAGSLVSPQVLGIGLLVGGGVLIAGAVGKRFKKKKGKK